MLPIALDSEGRGIDNVQWLRSKLFPIREDDISEQIATIMDWLTKRRMIIRYRVDGRKYFYSVNFKTYQTGTDKAAPSFLPAPQTASYTTPDLLQTCSGVSPEQVRLNTIQYNAEAEAEASDPSSTPASPPPFQPTDPADRVWRLIKPSSYNIPPTLRESVIPIIDAVLHRHKMDESKAAEEGKTYFDAWCKRRGKNGKYYSPNGTGWIDWWAQGEIPPKNGAGDEPHYSELHE